MTDKIISLATKRPPVIYTVIVCEEWDGSLSVVVNDIQDDPRSRFAVADAMSRGSMLVKERCQENSNT